MIIANKIHGKAFRGKLKDAIRELRRVMANSSIAEKQKRFLFTRMNEYKALYNESFAHKSENTVNNSSQNAWGQKDLSNILRERNERILSLEHTIEELQSETLMLRSESKRPKTAEMTVDMSKLEKAIADYEDENAGLRGQIAALKRAKQETELEVKNDAERQRAQIAALERSILELEQQRGAAAPAAESVDTSSVASELRAENLKYRERILDLSAELAAAERTARSKQTEIDNMKKIMDDDEGKASRRCVPEEAVQGDVEKILADELKNIAVAFDRVSANNKELEQQICCLHRKSQILFEENAQLKNKLKMLDETRFFVEKEKKRLECQRLDIAEQGKALRGREEELDRLLRDKEERIARYKSRLVSAEAEISLGQRERANSLSAHKAVADELESTLAMLNKLEYEHKRQTRIFDTFKMVHGVDEASALVDDLEMYRRILRCSLCDSNIKNCAIVKCMHCFCEECVQKQFKSRSRKCPVCECDFTMNDIKKLYL